MVEEEWMVKVMKVYYNNSSCLVDVKECNAE